MNEQNIMNEHDMMRECLKEKVTLGLEVIGEDEFNKQLKYHVSPCADATFFSVATLYSVRKEEFCKSKKEEIANFILNNFNKVDGGFRNSLNTKATIYGTFCSLLIPLYLQNINKNALPKDDDYMKFFSISMDEWIIIKNKIESFLKNSFRKFEIVKDDKCGGFTEHPLCKDGPTVTITSAALRIMALLGIVKRNKDLVKKSIMFVKNSLVHEKNYIAFAPSPSKSKQLWMCTTYYSLRPILSKRYIEVFNDYYKKFNIDIDNTEYKEKLFNFVKLCFDNNKGGFGLMVRNGSDGKVNEANLIHTKHALQLIKYIFDKSNEKYNFREEFSTHFKEIDINLIVKFTNHCETDEKMEEFKNTLSYAYFNEENTFVWPNVHATKNAIDIMNILGISFDEEKKEKIKNFIVNNLYDHKEKAFKGIPYPKI